MTVAELIKKLEKMPKDYEVGLSTDYGWTQATEVYEGTNTVYIGDRVGPSKSTMGLLKERQGK